ncbi:hypothetical protein GCM10009799_41960 [Nocardiopsis rhodophaea]|uniref:Uncharacterized protein n=1 Tax=Nocardiopsis rhodophaea TaxID=280238 RepID=A0ABP5EVS7_9ACTN
MAARCGIDRPDYTAEAEGWGRYKTFLRNATELVRSSGGPIGWQPPGDNPREDPGVVAVRARNGCGSAGWHTRGTVDGTPSVFRVHLTFGAAPAGRYTTAQNSYCYSPMQTVGGFPCTRIPTPAAPAGGAAGWWP